MLLAIDNRRLRELIPGVIHEVEGETPLLDKLLPWINSTASWLEDNFIGNSYELPLPLYALAEKIIVCKAFAEAIPSLDVILSPAGFAVINTDGRAPASKERIERLVASLNTSVDANTEVFLSRLHHSPGWPDSAAGQWWSATFIPDLSEVHRFRGQDSMLDTYRSMRSIAVNFEQELAENYLGRNTLAEIRRQQFTAQELATLITMIRDAELRYISSRMKSHQAVSVRANSLSGKCPDGHEVWHLIRPVLAQLAYYPALYRSWQSEMGHRLNPEPFVNNIPGGFYF